MQPATAWYSKVQRQIHRSVCCYVTYWQNYFRLDLSSRAALRGVHNVFHVLLLHDCHDNGVHSYVPPIEIDGEAEYEVSAIKGHRQRNGEL